MSKHKFTITFTYTEGTDVKALIRAFLGSLPPGVAEGERARLMGIEERLTAELNQLAGSMTVEELKEELTMRMKNFTVTVAEMVRREKGERDAKRN